MMYGEFEHGLPSFKPSKRSQVCKHEPLASDDSHLSEVNTLATCLAGRGGELLAVGTGFQCRSPPGYGNDVVAGSL
jgi:hypothetical protein